LAYRARWFCFSNPFMPRTLRVSILTIMMIVAGTYVFFFKII
jgi:hypothetical protein